MHICYQQIPHQHCQVCFRTSKEFGQIEINTCQMDINNMAKICIKLGNSGAV